LFSVSLGADSGPDRLFTFCRALKAFELTTARQLTAGDRQSAFADWWRCARDVLPKDADFDEWRFNFADSFAKTKTALGSNRLEEAARRLDCEPFPSVCDRFPSIRIKRLLGLCSHLQDIQGQEPFFLGLRDAARQCGAPTPAAAGKLVNGLIGEGFLVVVEKGTTNRATRFRYIHVVSQNPPGA